MKYVELRIYQTCQTAKLPTTNFVKHNLVSSERKLNPLSNCQKQPGIIWQTKSLFLISISVVVATLIVACSTISTYDQTAYLQAVNAKVDALILMGKATDLY